MVSLRTFRRMSFLQRRELAQVCWLHFGTVKLTWCSGIWSPRWAIEITAGTEKALDEIEEAMGWTYDEKGSLADPESEQQAAV